MAKDLKRAFGQRVLQLRKARGWSQETMDQHTGLHWTYIGQVERGERNLTLLSIQKIAKGFKVEIVELFKGLG
ncbi:MAG TPA: helix-turn-helix transcriptional regulator [Candidatus Angelobacter sp.]|nr:helix-turn-helix transcriptional regulator [Candidatus Angelobacter sp.]